MVETTDGLQAYVTSVMRERIARGEITYIPDPEAPPGSPKFKLVRIETPTGTVEMTPEEAERWSQWQSQRAAALSGGIAEHEGMNLLELTGETESQPMGRRGRHPLLPLRVIQG